MIARCLVLIGALTFGAGLSQFPEFSQQYEQRLSGAIDEMRVVVQNFDNTLKELGQNRVIAFAAGQDLSQREGLLLDNAKANIHRLDFLETALARVQGGSVLSRIVSVPGVLDRDIAARTYEDFKPAIPLTVDGLACACLGFLVGWILLSIFVSCLTFPIRTYKGAKA